jgi:DNA-binding NtrC family response regulator
MNNLLLIDDNSILLRALAEVLGDQLKECNVLTAKNGREGIAMMDSLPIAFILTDLEMPVLDGYGVINHRNKVCPHVPLFVMSSGCHQEVRDKLVRMSVSECIEKPFFFEQMGNKIARVLNVEQADELDRCR